MVCLSVVDGIDAIGRCILEGAIGGGGHVGMHLERCGNMWGFVSGGTHGIAIGSKYRTVKEDMKVASVVHMDGSWST